MWGRIRCRTTASFRQGDGELRTHLVAKPTSAGSSVERRQPVPRALLFWLFLCGTIGPALFDAVYLIEGVTRPGYDAWREPISTLMEGSSGWMQQANFVVLGVITLGVAVVWRSILKGDVCAIWYPIMRGIEGISLIMIGFSLTDPLHTFWLFMIIGAMMAGLFIIARRFWGDPNWRGWVFYSVASAVLINVFIALFGITRAQHFEYAGVFERIATNIEAIWGLALLGRLWDGVPFYRGSSIADVELAVRQPVRRSEPDGADGQAPRPGASAVQRDEGEA